MTTRIQHPVVVCEQHASPGLDVEGLLASQGYAVRPVADVEALIEAVVTRPPRAVVYELRHQAAVEIALLHLFRRVVPAVPLVLIACERCRVLGEQLEILRPAALAHTPLDPGALYALVREAVRSSAARRPGQALQPA